MEEKSREIAFCPFDNGEAFRRVQTVCHFIPGSAACLSADATNAVSGERFGTGGGKWKSTGPVTDSRTPS